MEENNVVVKKSHTGLIIFITVIVTLLVVFLGCFTYVKVSDKQKTDKTNTETKKEVTEETITSGEQDKLLEQIKDYAYFAESFPIKDVNSISSENLIKFAINYLIKQNNYTYVPMSKTNVENVIYSHFGSDVQITHQDINCFNNDGVLYHYDDSKEEYVKTGEHPHGGEGVINTENYFVSGTKKNDVYTIKVKTLYHEYCSDTCVERQYYATLSDAKNNTNLLYELKDSEEDIPSATLKEILTKIDTTTYIFTTDNTNTFALKEMK